MLRTTILKKLNIQFNYPESFIFDAVERGLRYGFMRFLKKNSAFEEALERAANSDDKLNAIFSVLYEYEDYLVEQQRSATENELYDLLSFKKEDLIQEKIVAFLDNAEDDIVECILISLSDQLRGVVYPVYPVEESKVDN